ncbi:MAG: hypothetical protein AAB260_03390, partial [Planctomycetota bacterium]
INIPVTAAIYGCKTTIRIMKEIHHGQVRRGSILKQDPCAAIFYYSEKKLKRNWFPKLFKR